MRTLYLDCSMGAAGDMLTAALLELIPGKEEFINRINTLGIPGVTVVAEKASKCGINGTHISVKVNGTEEDEDMHSHDHHDHEHDHHHDHDHEHEHEHSHHHSGMDDITHIVSGLSIPEKVKNDVLAVYSLIAEAESHAHGVSVKEIHFHEVGTMDAIADVTAVCLLMDILKADEVVVSPVHVGSGSVKCAHGILPVPAPATAYILKGVPIYGGEIKSELCTPTGAALLKHFATKFDEMPTMKTEAIGYGMGKKDFERANCVRAFLGEKDDERDMVLELCCNLDDMTPEAIGFAEEELLKNGALDVFTTPVQMKKSRPGVLLTVLSKEEKKDEIVGLIFKHTSTIGIRETKCRRYVLDRSIETVSTKYGEVKKKISSGYGVRREKYEYDDISRIARDNDLTIDQVIKEIE
ncbi:MAG: nickel pincer cofactor biosynthesis protein LarC [Spirochaetales bacterium]|nr:nickel pincer cofactor biosynthesis protein LarC [Spirochaetales bacterium]